jgi:hypothetical protein
MAYRLSRPTSTTPLNTSHFNFPAVQNSFFRTGRCYFCFPSTFFSLSMSKDSSFRLCIAALLIIQIACWALALVDLFEPGKPRLMIRTTMDVISQLFARRSAAMLLYGDFLAAF